MYSDIIKDLSRSTRQQAVRDLLHILVDCRRSRLNANAGVPARRRGAVGTRSRRSYASRSGRCSQGCSSTASRQPQEDSWSAQSVTSRATRCSHTRPLRAVRDCDPRHTRTQHYRMHLCPCSGRYCRRIHHLRGCSCAPAGAAKAGNKWRAGLGEEKWCAEGETRSD